MNFVTSCSVQVEIKRNRGSVQYLKFKLAKRVFFFLLRYFSFGGKVGARAAPVSRDNIRLWGVGWYFIVCSFFIRVSRTRGGGGTPRNFR